jgi:AraC-like DNA-binding protein
VRSHTSPTGGWEFATGTVPLLGEVCGYREWGGPVHRREVPHAALTLILSFDDPLFVGGVRHGSFVAGLHDRAVLTQHDGTQHGIEVRLTPAVAHALLRQPLDPLTNQVIALSDLLGRGADRLTDRLASATGWGTRFDLLSAELTDRLAGAPPLSGEVSWALDQLVRRHGRVPVGGLARATGWSQRHFATRFRAEVGMAPKAYARILRFQYAYQRMRAAPRQTWARIAADTGYYDQPHLNREFRELSGLSPAALLAAALPEGAGTAG